MRQTTRAVAIGLLLMTLGSGTALAGDRTSTPPWLRGDIWAGYVGGIDLVELQDRSSDSTTLTEVGRYSRHDHGINIGGIFSVYHGIAVRLDVPIVFYDRLGWIRANDIRLDPNAGYPTAVGGVELGSEFLDTTRSSTLRNGLGDLGLGVRLVPFAERGVPGRTGPASLGIDFDVRFPSGGNADKIRENGSTGPGEGGAQVSIGLAASRRLGTGEPYLVLAFTHRAPYRVDLSDAQSSPSAEVDDEGKTRLDPADSLGVRFGAEIIALEDLETDTSVRIDVSVGVEYRSADEISSGTLLPTPLDPTTGHRALTGEHVLIDAALGLRIRPKSPVELRVDFSGGWISPHTLERVTPSTYGVQTGPGSFELRWTMGALVRIR